MPADCQCLFSGGDEKGQGDLLQQQIEKTLEILLEVGLITRRGGVGVGARLLFLGRTLPFSWSRDRGRVWMGFAIRSRHRGGISTFVGAHRCNAATRYGR